MNNIKMNKKAIVLGIAGSLMVAGCANKPENYERYNRTSTAVSNDAVSEVDRILNEKENFILEEPEFGKIKNDYYVNKKTVDSIKSNSEKTLPIEFSKDIEIYSKQLPLDDLINAIENKLGVVVYLPRKELEIFSGAPYNYYNEVLGIGMSLALKEDNNSDDGQGPLSDVPEMIINEKILAPKLNYNGTLKGLLDKLSAYYGLKWKYDADIQKVLYYKFDTETFYVFSSKKDVESETTISTKSSSGADGESGSVDSTTSSDITISESGNNWEELISVVKGIVGENGSVTFLKQQRKVIVTAEDKILSQVSDFIKNVNNDASSQVVMNIDIRNIVVNSNDNININLNYINDSLTGKLADITGLSAFSITKNGLPSGENVTFTGSSDNKTDITGDVLSGFGTTVNAFSKSFITKNNETFPIQMVNNERYISKVSIDKDETSTTTSVEVDDVMDGITINVTPSIVGNRIELDLTGAISSNDGIVETEIGSEDSSVSIGLPREGKKNIHQEVIVPNGVPKVVSVIKKDLVSSEKEGPLSPFAWFFGGKTNKSEKEEYIIITVTAYINR